MAGLLRRQELYARITFYEKIHPNGKALVNRDVASQLRFVSVCDIFAVCNPREAQVMVVSLANAGAYRYMSTAFLTGMAVNLKTAKALSLNIPATMIGRADEVIG